MSKSNGGAAACCGTAAEEAAGQTTPGVNSAAPPATKYFENSRRFNISDLFCFDGFADAHIQFSAG
jgi:hypothetical protein